MSPGLKVWLSSYTATQPTVIHMVQTDPSFLMAYKRYCKCPLDHFALSDDFPFQTFCFSSIFLINLSHNFAFLKLNLIVMQ